MAVQEPLTIFADLSKHSDVLWDEMILRAIGACESFQRFECQLRGGALLVPKERTSTIEYGPRSRDVRERTSHATQSSVAFHKAVIRDAVATTRALTDFDVEELTEIGLHDWDVFTLSHAPASLTNELLSQLRAERGFLHAARPDPSNRMSQSLFWDRLSFFAYVSAGHAVRATWIDDLEDWVKQGYMPDVGWEMGEREGVALNFYDMAILPERRLASVPIPIPLRGRADRTVDRVRVRPRDVITRATGALPYRFSKSHKFDDPASVARFELPAFAADRMPDYRQVERRVREYCLVNPEKSSGFNDIGIMRTADGVHLLASQILAVVNDPTSAIHDCRLMSDGTLQFCIRFVASGPRGHMGAVETAWNFRVGEAVKLSTAHRVTSEGTSAEPPLLPSWTTNARPSRLLTEAVRFGESRASNYVESGRVVAGGFVAEASASMKNPEFCRWLLRQRSWFVAFDGLYDTFHVVTAVGLENEAVPNVLAMVDWLRACQLRVYPYVELIDDD